MYDFTPSSSSWSFLTKASLFKITPCARLVLMCFDILVFSWFVLQDVTGRDLLEPVSEEVNDHLTSDIAEVRIYCSQAYLKKTGHLSPIPYRQYQRHMAKGHPLRAMMAFCSCYIQIQQARQQLSSSIQQPIRCVCNLEAV